MCLSCEMRESRQYFVSGFNPCQMFNGKNNWGFRKKILILNVCYCRTNFQRDLHFGTSHFLCRNLMECMCLNIHQSEYPVKTCLCCLFCVVFLKKQRPLFLSHYYIIECHWSLAQRILEGQGLCYQANAYNKNMYIQKTA